MSLAMLMTKTGQNNEALDQIPELCKNHLATYPMSQKVWVRPKSTLTNSKGVDIPAFIAAESPSGGRRADYVYGPGPNGKGYYHLQTRVSYQILSQRLRQQINGTKTCCGPTQYEINSPKVREQWEVALKIVERRAKSDTPTEAPPVDNRVSQSLFDTTGSNIVLGASMAGAMCI